MANSLGHFGELCSTLTILLVNYGKDILVPLEHVHGCSVVGGCL
jgi:hypothetical protein